MRNIILSCALYLATMATFAQNSCASAVAIPSPGNYTVTGITGSIDVGTLCLSWTPNTVPKANWYLYTATNNTNVTITTNLPANNPIVDTRLHVYTGNCDLLTCLVSNDDAEGSFASTVSFFAAAGITYYFAFDNRWTANGFTFSLAETSIPDLTSAPVTFNSVLVPTVNTNYSNAVVDMTGDYLDDLVGVDSNKIRLHKQNADGGFTVVDIATPVSNFEPSWSIAAGDYNKDGYNDLMYGDGNGITFMKSNGSGTGFTEETFSNYVFAQRTNFVDLNNDGHLDAFSCHDVAPNVYYLNNGSGMLTFYQSGVTPGALLLGVHANGGNYGSLWTDYDNDGDIDLFIAKCRGGASTAKYNQLHRNNGNGSFTDVSLEANLYDPVQTWSSAVADFDNDGDMDILVGASSFADGGHKYMRNNGNGTFTDATAGTGWENNNTTSTEHVAYDFNNDGFVDVLGGGGKIMYNNGDGTFTGIASGVYIGGFGDLNNDGFIDVQNGNRVNYNNGNDNHWLKLNLQGIQSNRNGIGARVEIFGSWGKQIREVRSGEGFRYMSSLNVHFGIGAATTIDQVVVKWPSGVVDTFNNVSPDQTLFVVEGSTLGIDDFSLHSVRLYPNPVSNELHIHTNGIEISEVRVCDLSGKLLFATKTEKESLELGKLATGYYLVQIIDSRGNITIEKIQKL